MVLNARLDLPEPDGPGDYYQRSLWNVKVNVVEIVLPRTSDDDVFPRVNCIGVQRGVPLSGGIGVIRAATYCDAKSARWNSQKMPR